MEVAGGHAAFRGRHPGAPGATPAAARPEFAPAGVELRTVVRIGRRAAEGIIELAAEEEADLIIFGWGGRPRRRRRGHDAVFCPTIDEVVRDAPCNIAVVKQRGVNDVAAHPRARPRRPARRARARYSRPRSAATSRRRVDVMHVVPPASTRVIRAQAERALATFVQQHGGDPARPLLVDGHNVGQRRSSARPKRRSSW